MVTIQNLEQKGGTINITGLSGGDRPHIVADKASCHIEVRADRQTTLDSMTDELLRIVSKSHIEGTHSEFKKISGRPAMEFNHGTEKLFSIAAVIARDAGVELKHGPTGGGSDGNYLSPAWSCRSGWSGTCGGKSAHG